MIISHKYKFIFIKTRKTAGTSIETFLSSVCGDQDVFTPIYPPEETHRARNYKQRWNLKPEIKNKTIYRRPKIIFDWIKKRPFRNHSTALEVQSRVSSEVWNTYTKFCVERNPWDKTISHYYMCKRRSNPPKSFEEYLKRGKFCHNLPNYSCKNYKVIVDKVLKYENLNEELAELFDSLSIPFSGTLTSKAKGTYRADKRNYKEIFTDSQAKLIEKAFAREIELMDYRF